MKIKTTNLNEGLFTLNEAFSPSMPDWLKKSLERDTARDTGIFAQNKSYKDQRRYSNSSHKYKNNDVVGPEFSGRGLTRYSLFALLADLGLDTSKANFISADVPKKFSDPRLQWPDSSYIGFLYIVNNATGAKEVYAPGVNDSQDSILPDRSGNYKTLRYVPRPEVLANSVAFCYVDMTDPNNLIGNKIKDRKTYKSTKDNSFDRLTASDIGWGQTLDKSGYLINPNKYKNKLADLGLEGKSTQKKLETIYNRIKSIYRDAVNAMSDVDYLSDKATPASAMRVINNELSNAADYYKYMTDAVEQYKADSDKRYWTRQFRSVYDSAKAYCDRAESKLGDFITQEIDWDNPE